MEFTETAALVNLSVEFVEPWVTAIGPGWENARLKFFTVCGSVPVPEAKLESALTKLAVTVTGPEVDPRNANWQLLVMVPSPGEVTVELQLFGAPSEDEKTMVPVGAVAPAPVTAGETVAVKLTTCVATTGAMGPDNLITGDV